MEQWSKEVRTYLTHNPEGYWFKRKLYGWGWTPVTKEGWLVTLLTILFVGGNAVRFERMGYPDSEVVVQVILPTILAAAALIYICIRKGESPRWQWGPPHTTDTE